jgi:sec-independent protein translocase protein TatA
MGSFSIWHWLIVLLVVVLVFGTKKLRNRRDVTGGSAAVLRPGCAVPHFTPHRPG